MPWFVTVANPPRAGDPAQIVAGNERVVRRASPMQPLFLATRPASSASTRASTGLRRGDLPRTQLGSPARPRPERVRALARSIRRWIGGDTRARGPCAELAKCDLITSMVGGFPELQGLMGRYYASTTASMRGLRGAARAVPATLRRRRAAATKTRHGRRRCRQARYDRRHHATGQKPTAPATRSACAARRSAACARGFERGLDLGPAVADRQALAALPFADTGELRRATCATTSSSACGLLRRGWCRLRGEPPRCSTRCSPTRRHRRLDFDARLRALVRFLRLRSAGAGGGEQSASPTSCARRRRRGRGAWMPTASSDPAEQILGGAGRGRLRGRLNPKFAAGVITLRPCSRSGAAQRSGMPFHP